MKDREIEVAKTIIEMGLEQIRRSTEITMEHHLYGEALDIARSMRNWLGIITDVKCDWPECEAVATLDGAPRYGWTPGGWLLHPDHGRSYDLCPEHAAPYKECKWVLSYKGPGKYPQAGPWSHVATYRELLNEFGEAIFLQDHPNTPGVFVIEFGGCGSSARCAESRDKAKLEAILEGKDVDATIERLLFPEHRYFGEEKESTNADDGLPF